MKKWYQKLHWQILIGMGLGLIFGIVSANLKWSGLVNDWVASFGKIFINLLKLIAVPLVLTSLITGVASLSDTKKLSRIGGKTIVIYLFTTAVAVTIGLIVVNILQPGSSLSEEVQTQLRADFEGVTDQKKMAASEASERGPLQPLIDMVPDNLFGSASSNGNMLQIVFFSIFMGIALLHVGEDKSKPVLAVLEGVNEAIIQMVHLIMMIAPIGVFALIADTITGLAKDDPGKILELLFALGQYCFAVILGLGLQAFLVYPLLLKLFSPMKFKTFLSGIGPAQLLAFSTSSSGATLPVTMEQCEDELGVSEEVSSFVLPLGATINMDGTALYQAVAAVFIAQAMNIDLTLGAQLSIILTAVLASIGTAAVPGAGVVMLVIILQQIGVPAEGIGLILAVDRILDMCRTATNVTGDAAVAVVIAAGEGQLETKEIGKQIV